MSSQNRFGDPFIELHSVDSTNNYAMRLVHAGMAQHGTVVFAHEQTEGKGQRHKEWLSPAGKNITMSLVVAPFSLSIHQQFLLSMAVAIGAYQFFNLYVCGDAAIKWPNDIYWRDRKAGGILIENVVQGNDWKFAIIGIGLNINQEQFEGIKTKAVSLRQITGKQYDLRQLAKQLLTFLQDSLEVLTTDKEKIIRLYHQHLYGLNKKVCLKKNNKVFEALIQGVTPEGLLIAKHFTEEYFSIGEVEWIINQ